MNLRKPRKPTLTYYHCKLPVEVLAVVRASYFKDGQLCKVKEVVLKEDGQSGYDALRELLLATLNLGANVNIQSEYNPEDLGIRI